MLCKEVQSRNARPAIVESEAGKLREVRDEQEAKACCPMLVRPEPKAADVRTVQLRKADSPMPVTESGRLTPFRAVQL